MNTKPHVVVFFGGTPGNHDLSRESGEWFCEYAPRSKYQVTPVEVTLDGQWKVPLGSLPTVGPVKRMMAGLSQALRPLSPKDALQRLASRPISAFLTLLRGPGGDDGAMHSLGKVLSTPVMGSPLSASQHTSNKHIFHNLIGQITSTPHAHHVKKHVTEEQALKDIANTVSYPFFLKPSSQEGSIGVSYVDSVNELLPAFRTAREHGDVLVQEHQRGQELSVTVVEGNNGRLYTLPTTLIIPRKAPFYDHLAKRRLGRATFHTPNVQDNVVIQEAEEIARDVFQEMGCRGLATIDMIAGDNGINVLEVNTVPTFTQFTPLIYQLKSANMHPTALFDTLITKTLAEN